MFLSGFLFQAGVLGCTRFKPLLSLDREDDFGVDVNEFCLDSTVFTVYIYQVPPSAYP